MKSVIINMVERQKDATDIRLEALFASEILSDDGFSVVIEKRVRRSMWIRRMALPVATIVGGAIAVKPLAGLVVSALNIVSKLPTNVSDKMNMPFVDSLPALSTIMIGSVVVAGVILATRLLEEY